MWLTGSPRLLVGSIGLLYNNFSRISALYYFILFVLITFRAKILDGDGKSCCLSYGDRTGFENSTKASIRSTIWEIRH